MDVSELFWEMRTAAVLSFELVKGIFRLFPIIEGNSTILAMMMFAALPFAAVFIVGAVILSIPWYFIKKAYNSF